MFDEAFEATTKAASDEWDAAIVAARGLPRKLRQAALEAAYQAYCRKCEAALAGLPQ